MDEILAAIRRIVDREGITALEAHRRSFQLIHPDAKPYILLAEPVDQPQPPSSWLVEALLPANMSDDFLANLEEMFITRWVPRYGDRKARRIWRIQCWQMVGRQWLSPLLDAIEKVKKISIG